MKKKAEYVEVKFYGAVKTNVVMKLKRHYVEHIQRACEDYLKETEMIGNECAFTDSILECIFKEANKLQELQGGIES
jgi:abortive infection bacteriophage resistance protein